MTYILRYKTKDNLSPMQKQKVFYACTERDFLRSFEELSEDIFYIRTDCAILYLNNREDVSDEATVLKNEEELKEVLSGVQMVFAHVTEELLTTRNPAIDLILPYAKESGIPIFPALTEIGFDDLYENSILGGLQYRYKYDPSPGAIPYLKKVELYLRDHMLDSRQIDRIKDEFCAMMFLSYRKKDRLSARRLMRLIHKYRECEEIAIWYDEYLKEGEDFEKGIRDVLLSSDLLTMAVTPHLLEPNNYVMNIEYKEAKKNEIPVFPVEMEKTDTADLKRNYDGIVDPIASGNGAEIRDYLTTFLRDHGLSEKDDTPEHRYLMGLAYLDGIYVEADREKAIAFLNQAKDKNSYAALESLARLYNEGNGVLQDNAAAYLLQKNAVKLLLEQSADHTGEKRLAYCRRVFDAYRKLAEYAENGNEAKDATYDVIKALKGAIRAAEEGLSLSAKEKELKLLEEDCRLAHAALARAYTAHGDYSDAEQQLHRLEREYKAALDLAPEDDMLRTHFFTVLFEQINLKYLTGNIDTAFEDSNRFLARLDRSPETLPYDLLRVKCTLLMAKAYIEVGSSDDAMIEVWDSSDRVGSDIDLFLGVDEHQLRLHALEDVIETYLLAWYTAVVRGDGDRHPDWYDKAAELIRRYPKSRMMTARLQQIKLRFYTVKAKANCPYRKAERAIRLREVYDSGELQRSIGELEELNAESQAPEETSLILAQAYQCMALLCMELSVTQDLPEICDKACRLCENSRVPRMRFIMIDVCQIAAECLHKQNRDPEAVKQLKVAYDTAKKTDREYPSSISDLLLDTTKKMLNLLQKNKEITTFRNRKHVYIKDSMNTDGERSGRDANLKRYHELYDSLKKALLRKTKSDEELHTLQQNMIDTLVSDYPKIDQMLLVKGAALCCRALRILYRHTHDRHYEDERAFMESIIADQYTPEACQKYRRLIDREKRKEPGE